MEIFLSKRASLRWLASLPLLQEWCNRACCSTTADHRDGSVERCAFYEASAPDERSVAQPAAPTDGAAVAAFTGAWRSRRRGSASGNISPLGTARHRNA